MKKLSLAVAVATAIGAGAALAGGGYDDMAGFELGYLVPQVVHNGPSDTTAIGVTWSCDKDWPAGGTVYWAFFDVYSNHVTDGYFPMTKNDFHPLIWADVAGLNTEGVQGYMVLVADADINNGGVVTPGNGWIDSNDDNCISVSALQVQTTADDVIYVPTMALEPWDFDEGAGTAFPPGVSLAAVAYDPIATLSNGADMDDYLFMRYFIDGVPDNANGTEIVLWSAGHFKGNYTVQQYDTEQNRKSVTLTLDKELNLIDPEKVTGANPLFLDGFLLWEGLPDLTEHNAVLGPWMDPRDGDGFFSYSKIISAGFNAKQAILNGFEDY